jgi:anti-sigma regulatory factor (Ser/Thr protein kinase)
VLNNRIAAIEDGRRRLVEFLAGRALDEVVRHRLEVVFEELVSNTIRHGFAMHSNQSIHVQVEPKPGLVEFTFEDDGRPFNPLEAEPAEPLTSIETARVGGLGIPLVANLSAYLRYERPDADAGKGFSPCNRLVLAIAT